MLTAGNLRARLLPYAAETVLTAGAFVALHSRGLVADIPLWVFFALVVGGAAVRAAGDRLWGPHGSSLALHSRIATRLGFLTAIIYATGWGPCLALGYTFAAADNVRSSGSRAAAPVAIWSAIGIAAGQLFIDAGLAPSFIEPPLVHGLAILTGLGVTLSVRLIGTLTLERERTEALLQAQQDALAEAQAISGVGSWEWDLRSGRVEWSDELYRIHGAEPGSFEVTFDKAVELVPDEDKARIGVHVEAGLAAAVTAFRTTGRRVYLNPTILYSIDRADGRRLSLRGEGRILLDAHGTPIRLVGIVQDVSERVAAEAALRDALERERQASERLRALDATKTSLLQAVSHELRTPLTVIEGLAHTLSRPEVRSSPQRFEELLERLAVNATRLERLLTDLLDLDRLDRGIIEPRRRATDIAELVARVVSAMDGAIVTSIDIGEVVADVDPAKVERIVENLVSNAVRHTPPGTRVRIHARVEDGGLLLGVDDSGPGVPEDMRTSIFEPFVQNATRVHSPGTGIGLSLVRRFAELHGGRAWVEPSEHGGASFRVFLPARATDDAVEIVTGQGRTRV